MTVLGYPWAPGRKGGASPDLVVTTKTQTWWSPEALGSDILGIAVVGGATALGLWLGGRQDHTNVAIGYLFVISLLSMRLGYRTAILAAIASALCFDYYFLPPYWRLNIDNWRDIVTEVSMLGVAILASTLNEHLRKQARAARLSERQTESLYALAKALADARSMAELSIAGLRQIESVALVSTRLMIRNAGAVEVFSSGGRVAPGMEEIEAANLAMSQLEPSGRGTRNLSSSDACFLPLVATRGCIGVLAIRARDGAPPSVVGPSSLIESMTRQMAMAVERSLLVEEKHHAEIEAETERIRNAVLSAVSHDLRTPLTVITSASSTLVEHGERLQTAARAEMARLINEEANRLSALLKSLLDVTRLQAGRLSVNRDLESLEEVVASVLRRVEEQTGQAVWRLRTDVQEDLPLLDIDATLIEQVFLNLINNALTYAGNDLPIEINISVHDEHDVLVSVIDHGNGLSTEDLTRLFEKFFRVGGNSGSGLGLGLTLARGIVEAHGGHMWATATPGGGLTVQFTLPTAGAAPMRMEDKPSEGAWSWGQ
jgi:two-component system sensor histidine kinase KdpD